MSDRDARFRRLAPTGDLFAHFGVALEPLADPSPARIRSAATCSHCGWYVDVAEPACPVCARTRAPNGAL